MFGENKLNLVLVIGAVLIILIGWQFLMPIISPAPSPELRTTEVNQQIEIENPDDQNSVLINRQPDQPVIIETIDRASEIASGNFVNINGKRIRGRILLTGALFDEIYLQDYRKTNSEDSENISVFVPRDSNHPYFAEFGWETASGDNIPLPNSTTKWQADRYTLSPGEQVNLTWDNGENLKFTRTISLDENYLFKTIQKVENTGSTPISLVPFGRISRFDTPAAGQTSMFAVDSEEFVPWGMFGHGGIGVLNGKKLELSYEDMQDVEKNIINSRDGWIGITDKYWLSALIPDQTNAITAIFKHSINNQRNIYHVDYRRQQPLIVNPNASVQTYSHLFVGAKEFNILEHYENVLGTPDLNSAVDFGLVWFLAKPLFYPIDYFFRSIGNFGVAILILTVCVRILLYPLANKAYASMSRMRKLQPDTIMLRERYKHDKAKMNMELMALYRREKANPMAGCLPMLVQIPVFFALYSVLFATIEMRHAPFFGWIQDLSAPDPLTFITLFGVFDWDVPDSLGFIKIGIWPILFSVTMLLQMKLNPQPVEPIQQKIMMFLPLLFLFMFAQFPAGLVVYWTWNNVLSIGQQWLIMRRMGITKASLQADAAKIKKIKEQAEAGTLPKPSSSRAPSRKRKRSDTDRAVSPVRKKTASKNSDSAPAKRKKSFREITEEIRQEKARQKKRRMRAAEAKKRAKIRKQTKSDTFETTLHDTDENKLSRRQRRAAKAKQQESTDPISDKSNVKSETGQWKEEEKGTSRQRRRKKRPTRKR